MELLEGPSQSFQVERWHNGDYTVRVGDRYQDRLGKDEALWLIVQLLIEGEHEAAFRWLKTAGEHQHWWNWLNRERKEES